VAIAYVRSAGRASSAAPDAGGSFALDATGGNILLVVLASRHFTNTVSSITYAGQALTLKSGPIDQPDTGGQRGRIWLYYLVNPPSGSNTLAYTLSSATYANACSAEIWSGVDTGDPFGTVATASGDPSPATVNVTSSSVQTVVDAVGIFGGTTIAVGGGQTSRDTRDGDDGGGNYSNTRAGHSSEPGAGSVTMSWTFSDAHASAGWCIIGVPLKPGVANNRAVWVF